MEPSLFEDGRRRSLKAAKRGFANSKGVSSEKKGGCLIFWMSWVQNTKWSKGSDIPPLQLLSILFSFQHPPSNSFLFYSPFNIPLQLLSILFSFQHPFSNSFLFYSPFNIAPPTPFYFILLSPSFLQLLSILFSFQHPLSNSFLFYSPFNIPPPTPFYFILFLFATFWKSLQIP